MAGARVRAPAASRPWGSVAFRAPRGRGRPMRTIAFTTQKGGSGKSTLAIDLAVAAMQEGERVIILDTDRQGTGSHWRPRRADPEPVVEQIVDDAKLVRLVHPL